MSFISLYCRYQQFLSESHPEKKEAVSFLENGSEYEYLMPIAVINSSNKIVWHSDFLGLEHCQERVEEYLKKKTT